VDTQIKLRGMRIELGEIESVVADHPDVQQAVVLVRGETEQQKLSAYVVAKRATDVSAAELRRHARSKLPEYMTPSEFWKVDSIPLLPSGKVNRAALASAGKSPLRDEDTFVGPRSETEARLAAIWSELLKLEKIGMDQNFFELGGHSLRVLQMTARIRRSFNIELPARRVFESPTIEALAKEVEKTDKLGATVRAAVRQHQRPANHDLILSQLQQLSAEDVQNLLKSMLEEKQADPYRLSRSE
jgi:acyl carrier protein